MGRSLFAGAFLATFAITLPVWADSNLALGETLFRDGKRLMDQGKFAEACPKFEESYRVDPAGGALLNLALCHEKAGKTATAWSEYINAAARAKRDGRADRENAAVEHAKTLEASLSRVTLVLAGAQVPGLEVRLDDTVVGSATWGTAVPMDPGEHHLEATAPGKKAWKATVTLGAKKDVKQVTIPQLVDEPAGVAASVTAGGQPGVAAGGQPGGGTTTPERAAPSGAPSKTTAYIVGGLGIVSLGVGSFFGLQMLSKKKSSDDQCSPSCTQAGVDAMNQAKTAAWIADVGIGVGLVGVGVAVYLLVKPAPQTTVGTTQVVPLIGSSGGGLVLQRTW